MKLLRVDDNGESVEVDLEAVVDALARNWGDCQIRNHVDAEGVWATLREGPKTPRPPFAAKDDYSSPNWDYWYAREKVL